MKLSSIFKEYKGEDVEISGLSINSKTTKDGDLFICIKGINVDRHDYIDEAIKNGAVALICAKDVNVNAPYIKVDNPNNYLRYIYTTFYGNPQDKLSLIGVTGTDGKTSTTTIIQQLIGDDKCGYIGTNGYACKNIKGETDNTTPGIESLYSILAEFNDAGCAYVSMETSSEAFYHHRLDNLTFAIGILTNVDREHLNTHKTLENYINCKKQLFRQSKIAILNSNDKYFEEFKDINKNTYTYGYKQSDDLYIKNYEVYPNKTEIDFLYDNKEYHIVSPLLGKFNIENLAAAILACLKLDFSFEQISKNIDSLFIDGRMMSINLGQDFHVLVDYAHTPNGLKSLFEFTNKLKVNKKIVVTGNAGQRDASKRKYVGELCVLNNDHVIFTYEDPRFEDPLKIIDDLTELVKDKNNYETVIDRKEAIIKAINMANKDDLIMILGKGNEDWQIIKGEFIEFNDCEQAKKAIKEKLKQSNNN